MKNVFCSSGKLDELKIIVACEDSVLYESPYLGQHGISLVVKGTRDGITKTVLMDVGQNPTALLENFRLMGIDPSGIDAILLTHCHYDHTQGLTEILNAIGKKDVPVVAHPSIFRLNFLTDPFLRHVGVMQGDSEEKIMEAGGTLYMTSDPVQFMPGLFSTGEVKRQTDFEEVGISLYTLENGKIVSDTMKDDISLIACVKDKNPVIMTGCSHAGIVNIVKQASEMCGTDSFENVIGGFHLVEAPEDRIEKTASALKKFKINSIMPGHCTGFRAQASIARVFGKSFRQLQTGIMLDY